MASLRFNEAAGFTQRKRSDPPGSPAPTRCFNEAAGFTQRKPATLDANHVAQIRASMRPPVLPSGNEQRLRALGWTLGMLQ